MVSQGQHVAKRLGVGTYRLASSGAMSQPSVLHALRAGFSVIDTASNYGNGEAELGVGQALSEWDGPPVEIVSKFGFIQGEALDKHREKPFPDAVDCADHAAHSIHPEVMRQQLDGSLGRLGLKQLDTYLVHNPEHFLISTIPPETAIDSPLVSATRERLLERLEDTFVALEEEVQKGKIKRFGISSNSFAMPLDTPHFVPFEELPALAKRAATRAGSSESHFQVMQFPANMLERAALCPVEAGGNGCAQFAHANGLETMVSRALTAYDKTGSWRLAQAEFPTDYASKRAALLEHITPGEPDTTGWTADDHSDWAETLEACTWLRQLVTDLDSQLTAFSSVMHYHDDFLRRIVPMLNAKLDGIDDETSELLHGFFNAFDAAVRSVSGDQTRSHIYNDLAGDDQLHAYTADSATFLPPPLPVQLSGLGGQPAAPLQDLALGWLWDHPCVSTVLLGATRPAYADQAAQLLRRNTAQS